ncbi:hypothetical protein BDR07DRAFT_87682 [Suillus spraguei]|nr:hypothetical protein BDR07DRAFT_87682 [Suillus spraguei]
MWNKHNPIVTGSKHGAYPARTAQPTPVTVNLTTGFFAFVFLIRYVTGNMDALLTRSFSCSSIMCRRNGRGENCDEHLLWRRQHLSVCLPATHLFHLLLSFSSHRTVTPLYVWLRRMVKINASLPRISAWCEFICSLLTLSVPS